MDKKRGRGWGVNIYWESVLFTATIRLLFPILRKFSAVLYFTFPKIFKISELFPSFFPRINRYIRAWLQPPSPPTCDGPGPLEQVHLSVGNVKYCMKSIFASWFLEKIWLCCRRRHHWRNWHHWTRDHQLWREEARFWSNWSVFRLIILGKFLFVQHFINKFGRLF